MNNQETLQELLHYLKILRKRWWLILLLVVSTVSSILVAFYTAKPVYQSSLKFLFTSPPIAELTVYGDFRNPSGRDEIPYARANFIEILSSKSTVWQAIEASGGDISADDVVVIIEPSETSEIVRLAIEMEDPQLAADLANALMDAALQTYGTLRAKPTTMSHAFISQQLEASYTRWKQAQERLAELQTENGITNLNSALESQQSLLISLTLERDSALAKEDLQTVTRYDEIIAKHKEELQNLIWLSSQYAELEMGVKQTWNVYELLLSRETEATLKENEILNVGFVSVLGPARPPNRPISAFNSKLVLLGTLVSFAVGVLLAFGWEYLEAHNIFGTAADWVATDKHGLQESLS